MATEVTLNFKIYLRKKDHDIIIRRMLVKRIHSNSFQYILNKIRSSFPEVKDHPLQVMWNDSEDMVHISSDEELVLALTYMKGATKKFYVKCGTKKAVQAGSEKVYFDSCKKCFPENNLTVVKTQKTPSVQTKTISCQVSTDSNVSIETKTDCIEQLNTNIEEVRLHLINPNGTVSTHYDDEKMQRLRLCLKQLECLIQKVQSETRVTERVQITDDTKCKMAPKDDIIDMSLDEIVKSLSINCNTVCSVAQDKSVASESKDDVVNDSSGRDHLDLGPSVQTLSEVSSEDEMEKWTFLDEEKREELPLESLPDIATRLEKLKSTEREEEPKDIAMKEKDSSAISDKPLPASRTPEAASELQDNTQNEQRAVLPHIAAGLDILYHMGFKDKNNILVELLEACDGNVCLVLDMILIDKK